MAHWQYLGHVEPVLPTARTAVPGRAEVELPDLPPRQSVFAVALIAAVCAFVPAPVQAQTPTGWQPQIADPVRTVRRVVDWATGAERPLEVPRSQHITWQPRMDVLPQRRAVVPTVATGAENPRWVLATGWRPQLPDLLHRLPIPPAVLTGAECPVVVPAPAPLFLGWLPQLTDAPRPRARVVATETGAECPVRVAPVVAAPLGWLPQLEPVPRRRADVPTVYTGAERPTFPPTPVLVSIGWLPQMGEPGRRRLGPGAVLTGAERPLEVPRSQHMTWQPQLQPLLRRARPVVSFATGAEWVSRVVVTPVPLAWARPLELPVRRRVWVATPLTGAEWVALGGTPVPGPPRTFEILGEAVVEIACDGRAVRLLLADGTWQPVTEITDTRIDQITVDGRRVAVLEFIAELEP